MCGRFVLDASLDELRRLFGIEVPATNLEPRYNIAPAQPVCVIRLAGEDSETGVPVGQREMVMMRWGLVPDWMKDWSGGRPLINARSESVAEKPSFRSAYRYRRCLVPANGWYEWLSSSGRGAKQPIHIRLRDPRYRPFAFAGIWELWTGPDGESRLYSLAILTMPAHRSLASIHHRMPVVLAAENYDAWLCSDARLPFDILAKPGFLDDGAYETFPVTTRVNRVSAEGPGLLAGAQPDQSWLL